MEPYAVTNHRFKGRPVPWRARRGGGSCTGRNVVGNVWEWTAEGLLRGGSYLCHPSYCDRNQLSGRSEGDAPMGHIGFRAVSAR
jgi:hypothetical protein